MTSLEQENRSMDAVAQHPEGGVPTCARASLAESHKISAAPPNFIVSKGSDVQVSTIYVALGRGEIVLKPLSARQIERRQIFGEPDHIFPARGRTQPGAPNGQLLQLDPDPWAI